MTATATPPSATSHPLTQQLARVRRHLRFVNTFRGISWLVALVLGTLVLGGLVDWLLPLPGLFRALILVQLLVTGGLAVYFLLYQPLSRRQDDLTLALEIEEHYPHLNDALASTVEFLDQQTHQPSGNSSSMQREAVRRALARAGRCDFEKVINRRGLTLAAVSGLTFTALVILLVGLDCYANPAGPFGGKEWRQKSLTLTGLVRLAHPFGRQQWPRKTQLELEEPRTRIGRNEAFTVRGTVRGEIPEKAHIFFRFEGFPAQEHEVKIQQQEDGSGKLETTLPAGKVQRSFYFQVQANDALSEEYRVEVLAPPTLVALNNQPSPQVRLDYPAYTDLPSPHNLPAGTGNIEAVTGTVATLRAQANRPLARAWIEYQPQERHAPLALFLAPLGTSHLAGTLASLAGGRGACAPVPGRVQSHRLMVRFQPSLPGMYALHFEDESGLHNSRLFELRLQADPAPVVHLHRPSRSEDILTVLPDARLPLEVSAEDTRYALRNVYVHYRTQQDTTARRLSLYDPSTFLYQHVAPWAGAGVVAGPTPRLRPTRLEFARTLDLSSLRHASGQPLRAGDTLFLMACAEDYDNVTVGKAPGRSHEIEIKIITRPDLDLVLHDKQAEIQQELLRIREKQREAAKRVTAIEDRLEKGDKLNHEDLDELQQADQLQQQIKDRVGDRKDGLRSEVARVLRTLKQNDLEHAAAQDRMAKLLAELDRLANNELQRVGPQLTEARKLAELLDEKARAERRAELERQAQQTEGDARQAEQTADRRENEASEAEKQAAAAREERERARLLNEAAELRKRAEELRTQSQALRQQAASLRREAAQTPDEAGPQKALDQARRDQEEIEKTINQLLADLEPWSSLREVKGEAGRIRQEQRSLRQRVEELRANPEINGKERAELNPRQRVELDNLEDAQKRLERRAAELLEKMKRVSRERAEKEPETARDLKEAADQAERENLVGQMREAAGDIGQNQLNDAQRKQADSLRQLDDLVKKLEDRREEELERLSKKMKEAQRDLAKLVEEQEQLRKKIKEAQQLADLRDRKEALEQLGRQQQALSKKAEELAERLSRLRAERARQALDRAREQMEDALEELTRGEKTDEEQKETLERLQEAQQELEQANQETEEELRRERLARVADVLKRFMERQQTLHQEAERVQQKVQQEDGWNRFTRLGLLDLQENQKLLGEETKGIAEKDLKSAPVFARLLEQTAEAMQKAAERFGEMIQDPPEVKSLPDAEVTRQQALALRRLEQVVKAVEDAAQMPGQQGGGKGGGGGQGEGGQGGGGGGSAGDGIPPLAQLKLLRIMQEEVNQRTEAFQKKHPDINQLNEQERKELQEIYQEQKDITTLVKEMRGQAEVE